MEHFVDNVPSFKIKLLVPGEPIPKGTAQYDRPPRANLFRSALFHSKNINCLGYKTRRLVEVYCTAPFR
jgi:hypothetical protein